MKLNSNELNMIQKALKGTIKAELDKTGADYSLIMELSVITRKIDEKVVEDEKVKTTEKILRDAKKRGAPITANRKLVISLLKDNKMSYSKIAKMAKCSKATVCRVNASL